MVKKPKQYEDSDSDDSELNDYSSSNSSSSSSDTNQDEDIKNITFSKINDKFSRGKCDHE